jgi:hypothetical protein
LILRTNCSKMLPWLCQCMVSRLATHFAVRWPLWKWAAVSGSWRSDEVVRRPLDSEAATRSLRRVLSTWIKSRLKK